MVAIILKNQGLRRRRKSPRKNSRLACAFRATAFRNGAREMADAAGDCARRSITSQSFEQRG